MAYSNTSIPQLPSYDTSASPYAVALFSYGKGEEDWYQLIFAVSASAFKASFVSMDDGNGNVIKSGMAAQNTGVAHRWICGEDGVWEAQADGDIVCMPGLSGAVYQRVWTNHNILDQFGNIWLAANSVSPMGVSESWLRSFKMGLALGLTGAPLPFPQKKLIGFLYGHIAQDGETPTHTINGVDYVGAVLPEVPEWDKEKYPYWILYYTHTTIDGLDGWYWRPMIQISSEPFYIGTWTGDASSPVTITDGPYGISVLKANGGTEWGEFRMVESTYWIHGVTIYFANHDVLYANSTDWGELANTVRVPKSDPIPVYE